EDDPHLQGDPEVVGELTDTLDEVPGGTGRSRIEVAVKTVPFDLRCGGRGHHTRGAGEDGAHRECSLTGGTEVADHPGVGLLVDLLGRGPRSHEAVETRDRTAGDGDEQQREPGR